MSEPIIDIHQHLNYADRTDAHFLQHQRHMGVTQTVLLPAGTPVERPSTHMGKSNGLAAKITGNDDLSIHLDSQRVDRPIRAID